MSARYLSFVAVGLLSTGVVVARQTVVQTPPVAPPAGGQYLIAKLDGAWEVRQDGQKERPVGAKFDIIVAPCQIRCVKAPCTLDYFTRGESKPFFSKPPALDRWTPVPAPTEPPVARTAVEMQQLIGRAGVRGGAEKGSTTCSGDLTLLAPRCNETIDPAEFSIRWIPRTADAGKTYTLLIGNADSSERRRWNSIAADAGMFQSKDVQDYLEQLQQQDRTADVALRLLRSENLDAVRLVRVLSRADEVEHRHSLREADTLPELPRRLAYLAEFLKLQMWSSAAEVSRGLLDAAPDSLEMKKYAMVGLCGSDYAEDAARVRAALREAGVTGLCDGVSR